MAKRKKDPDGHGRPAAGAERSVYFDTSLDTHLLLTVSDSDTVADLKKKIVYEHLKCFPDFGKIIIHALKVKRKQYFYHLSESMLVRCAFEGVTKSWFLSVDASKGQNSLEYSSLDPTLNEKGFALLKLSKNEVANSGKAGTLGTLGKDVDCNEDDFENKTGYVQFNSREESLKPIPCEKKQRRIRKKSLEEHNYKAGAAQPSHLQEVMEDEYALVIYDGSNRAALSAEFVPEVNPLCSIVPLNVDQQIVPASTGNDTNGIASATANGKSNTFEVGATNESKQRKHTKKQISRDQGIHASPVFHDFSNADKHGAEIGSEDKHPSNAKNKKRKLPSDHDISSQDAEDRQNNDVIVKDFNYNSEDKRPKKRSKKSVAVNPNLPSKEDEICKGKTAIDEAHNIDEKKEISLGDCKVSLLEKFDSSHQDDTNVYAKEATSSAEFVGTNKEKEYEKSKNGKKLKKSTKRSFEVHSDALSMENDCGLENKTDEKIEAPVEKDHKIMLSEEVGPELQIGKTVGVKELGNATSEQRKKKVKGKKSVAVKPSASVMMNDNLQTESFLPDHSDSSYGKEESQHEDDPDRQIKALDSAEFIDTNKARESVKTNTGATKKKRSNKHVMVKPATTSEKNVNPCSGVSATDHTSESDERGELPVDDEAMLSERGDNPSRKEDESFLASLPTKNMLSQEVGPELLIGKAVGVKELGYTTSEQRKKVKGKKLVAVKPSASVMVDDNLQTESFLPDHTDKTYGKEESQHEDDSDRQIKALGPAELIDTNKVRESVKSNTGATKKKRSKKLVMVKPVTMSEKNVNPCSDVSAADHTSKSDERRELPDDDEAMLSEKGDDPSRKEEESFLASQIIEAPEENPKDSENLKKKVKRMQISMMKTSSNVNLKEQSSIDCIAKDAGSKVEKKGKKKKKKKVLNVKSHPDLPFEEQEVASQEFNPQSDTIVQEEASDINKKSKSLKSGPENQLAGGRVLEEDTNSTTADVSSILADTAINSNLKSESSSLNFKEYFVSELVRTKQVVDKVSEASRSNEGPEVTKGKKRSSLDLSSSDIQFQGLSSKVEPKSMSKSISQSHKLLQIKSVPGEAGWTDSNGLETRSPALASMKKNTESSRVPISRSETSKSHVKNIEKSSWKASHNQDLDVSKASRSKIGEIINSSQNKKSLLARSGTIFRDDSSDSSKDDNGEETSDSSTESPSDSSSSSSGYSDASNLRSNSQRNATESFGNKGKESGKKNINEPRTPASKKLSLNMILKSSSRFKKARLTAIESQHEDSETVDIVPESQV